VADCPITTPPVISTGAGQSQGIDTEPSENVIFEVVENITRTNPTTAGSAWFHPIALKPYILTVIVFFGYQYQIRRMME